MKLSYTLSREDYNSFGRFSSAKIRRMMNYYFLFLCVVFVLLSVLHLSNHGMDANFMVYAVVVLFFVALWYVIYRRLNNNNVNFIEKSTGKRIQEEAMTVEANETQLIYQKPGIESKINWEYLVNYRENEEWMLIYSSAATAIPIPKKKVEDTESLEAFLELVRRKLTAAR